MDNKTAPATDSKLQKKFHVSQQQLHSPTKVSDKTARNVRLEDYYIFIM